MAGAKGGQVRIQQQAGGGTRREHPGGPKMAGKMIGIIQNGASLILCKTDAVVGACSKNQTKKHMKTTNALVAAALAGVFAAGTTVSQASQLLGSPVAAEKEKDDCPGKDKDKDKDKCPGKEKKEGTVVNEKEKDACPGKDKDKDKEKKEGEIL